MVDVAGARVVAILTRAPSAGGKTRLFAELSRPGDEALLEALLLDTIEGSRTPGAVQVVAVEPADAANTIRPLIPDGIQVMGQADGALGARMHGVLSTLLGRGARAVVLIGSDLPDIDNANIVEAFEVVESRPEALVLGPATDGGYYLIGTARVPDIFDGIPWGTRAVLEATLDAARRSGTPVHLVGPMADVDTATDLDRLTRIESGRATRTVAWTRRNRRTTDEQ